MTDLYVQESQGAVWYYIAAKNCAGHNVFKAEIDEIERDCCFSAFNCFKCLNY